MASELSYTEGISVIPVSRVLGALAAQGAEGVESPSQAFELTKLLGADAVLVFAVIEYDPYDPPTIGISAQLYGSVPRERGSVDPVALSRRTSAAVNETSKAHRLLAQTQRVFNAAHDDTVHDIRKFAAERDSGASPYGWRQYVVNQQGYIRYCCHATIRGLLNECDSERMGRRREGMGRRRQG
jgi:hypothetical protein